MNGLGGQAIYQEHEILYAGKRQQMMLFFSFATETL